MPRTLVSSDPDAIRDFARTQGGTVIAKTLTGLLGTSLEAGRVIVESLVNDEEMSLSATIYQEEVPGTDHLRVMVFGEQVHVARIRSGALDWRLANDMEVEPIAGRADARPRSCVRSSTGSGCGWGSSTSSFAPTARSVSGGEPAGPVPLRRGHVGHAARRRIRRVRR